MTEPATSQATTMHATFSLERRIRATPDRVYRAWSDPAAKQQWFGGAAGEWTPEVREMDFRVGGTERVKGAWAHGMVSDFRAVYHDIVPGQRIVYVYDMYVDDRKLSVSLATIEITPDGDGTRLVITEQGTYFEQQYESAGSHGQATKTVNAAVSREQGTRALLEAIARSVE